jgi:hypothetical protein
MFASVAEHVGAPRVAASLRKAAATQALSSDDVNKAAKRVLNTALKVGKARFAQVACQYVDVAADLPAYIRDGVIWVRE